MTGGGVDMGHRPKRLWSGLSWEELEPGARYRTFGRTVTETDIVNFISCTGMLEALFTDDEFRKAHSSITGRVAPAALVYAFSEGLVLNAMAMATGLAFLRMDMNVIKPTFAGDTIHVDVEILETKETSGGRGLVKTRNTIINQRNETVMEFNPLRLMAGRKAL